MLRGRQCGLVAAPVGRRRTSQHRKSRRHHSRRAAPGAGPAMTVTPTARIGEEGVRALWSCGEVDRFCDRGDCPQTKHE